ncbi:uncharacterized protein lrif1 [Clarias gariepinus]|uniref:ligand-dependent nuclear receptor-interacting factor 1 n=1 Tax=Clarias gariepinus TaxID=13013 RepID=UPI00234C0F40|nr:ligand-dependent nuclear receptor-interacting factor 1 [Clarias gariepinus]
MQSGTGVYYQAMPAVGPDGKNVMKLIPVKKVNGRFVQMQVPSRNVCQPAHMSPVPSPQNRIPMLQPTADGRFILKTPLEVNTVFNSVKSQHRGSNVLAQSPANQVHVPLITQNITPTVLQSPIQTNNKAVIVTNSPQLPSTVKPSALPSGHYLQIPSNATVRTLPASALPSSIKNRICHSTNDTTPLKGLPMVLYVSPVSSLKLDKQVTCLAKPSEVPKTLGHTSTASVVKSPEESPRGSQGGTAPMKWVVEERAGSSAPYLIPVTSPTMSSDILTAVKHMESSRIPNQVAKEPESTNISKETVSPGNNNALVMCNGKVFFVAKKNSDGTKDMITNSESKLHSRKSAQAPITPSATSNQSQMQDPKSPVDNIKSSDIIDLCDDDEESSSCTSSGRIIIPNDSVSEHEEDSNVIFVSYIPPKTSEIEIVKEGTETGSLISCEKDTDDTNLDTESKETCSKPNSTCAAKSDASKCEVVHENAPALGGNQALAENLEVVCGQQPNVTEKSFNEVVPDQTHQPKSDSELRRTYGITSDLSVSLQKIYMSKESQAQEGYPQNEKRLINKRTLDGIRKLIRDSKIETKIKRLIETKVPACKRKRLERNEEKNGTEQEAPSISDACKVSDTTSNLPCSSSLPEPVNHSSECQSDSPACCSGLRKTPPRSSKGCRRVCTACPCGTKVGGVAGNSPSKPREQVTPCSSVTSSKSISSESDRDVNTADGLTDSLSNKNSASGKSRDKTKHCSQSHVSKDVKGTLSTATISTSHPGGQPAMTETCSSSSKHTQDKTCDKSTSSQLETGTEIPNPLKDVRKISSSIEQLQYTSYKIPDELYSSVLLDPEEIKRQERIKRLKDLLQEKEAALEKLRRSM